MDGADRVTIAVAIGFLCLAVVVLGFVLDSLKNRVEALEREREREREAAK